ncbi:DUF1212-domain-containing protein [Xylariaceae sp. FL0255]|nr:DUF1212-domain-containing protein [Xylariaceae sp. FL0255]
MDHGPTTPLSEATPSATTPTEAVPGQMSPESGTTSRKEKNRVRFNSRADVEPSYFDVSTVSAGAQTLPSPTIAQPRPSVLRKTSNQGQDGTKEVQGQDDTHADPGFKKAISAENAHARAKHVHNVLSGSTPNSQRSSIDSEAETIHSNSGLMQPGESIQLDDLTRISGMAIDGTVDDTEQTILEEQRAMTTEAYNLVRSHTLSRVQSSTQDVPNTALSSGRNTPTGDRDAELYIPPPQHYRGGVLSNLLKLYKSPEELWQRKDSYQKTESNFTTPGSSGTSTPTRKKWYDKGRSSDSTLANLVEASARLASVSEGYENLPKIEVSRPQRPKYRRNTSIGGISFGRKDEEIKITMHIAETLSRQKYIIRMCRALMMYGAPTHRLEEYLRMSARVLEVEGQFLYLPGCMIISFDDKSTHTTDVKIVRTDQGINLGKLKDIHDIYKSVLHDLYSVEEAMTHLKAVTDKKELHPWIRVLMFGLASAAVGPFAFQAGWIDIPLCGLLGSMVGALQIFVAPKSALYNNIFEISASVFTSFLSRALGSIKFKGEPLFCFSALAQSSIALILPGWFVLSAALELQSRSLVPGSIRLVYAVIYSLFLGFGITVGIVLYGVFDSNAISKTTCEKPIDPHIAFIFVPLFTTFLALVNQAKWKQLPVMIVISFAGYIVNFFSSPRFQACPQIANTLGAFTVGVLANLYSRLRHGVAATALLPAIFVQVPSGLAATGSLLSGLTAANELANSAADASATTSTDNLSNVIYNVAGSMIQIAIGISLGLFMSSLLIYPFGKRRSGLWTL